MSVSTEPSPRAAVDGQSAPLVQLTGVSRVYRLDGLAVTALHDVNLAIDEGEFVVVLGPSGSGKTTLLNLIGGLDAASSGRIAVAGRDLTGASRSDLAAYRRQTTSFIFQTFNLFPGLSAMENVAFGASVAGRPNADEIAREMLGRVGLADRVRHFPHQLSGGEQQRVAIARALATGNPLVLADEPTGELDFRTGVQILELLHEQSHHDRAVIVVTHNREISRCADRVIELSSGEVIHDGEPAGGQAAVSELHW